jgi:signal peptidase II
MVWIVILAGLVLLDQMLKHLVVISLTGNEARPVIDQFFYIVNRRNTGAAWSFLADRTWGITVLSVLSAVASVVLLYLLFWLRPSRYKLPLVLMTAGAIGNLIDRVKNGAVVDYLDFHFGSYIFPTFNLADMCLVTGTILLAILLLTDPNPSGLLQGHTSRRL